MAEGRHRKSTTEAPSSLLDHLDALEMLSDVSTANPCPPCASQATTEYITNRDCPGGTDKEGEFMMTRDLCKGCCYELQDPGPLGKGGRNAGNYVDAASGKMYQCKYTFNVSKIWFAILLAPFLDKGFTTSLQNNIRSITLQ